MNFRTYLYCVGKEWDKDDTSKITILGGYSSAAEDAVERYESDSAEYSKDTYTVWIMEIQDTAPRKFTVHAETTRTYSSLEEVVD